MHFFHVDAVVFWVFILSTFFPELVITCFENWKYQGI